MSRSVISDPHSNQDSGRSIIAEGASATLYSCAKRHVRFRYVRGMADTDLNLLTALDALLAEGSVTGAARRLRLSASAMSRTLARLRAATGDPLLVRAGRGLVPTPRATELRDRVHELARDVRTVLSPQAGHLDVASL